MQVKKWEVSETRYAQTTDTSFSIFCLAQAAAQKRKAGQGQQRDSWRLGCDAALFKLHKIYNNDKFSYKALSFADFNFTNDISMDRAHFDSRAQSNLRITGKIIELNDVVWSVQNLVAIAITKKVIHFNDAAPTFNIPEPKFRFPTTALIIPLAIIALSIFNRILFATLTFLCVTGFLLYFRNYRRRIQISHDDWMVQQQTYVQETRIWKYKKENPPILYGLILETSAASRSTIFSYDRLRIKEAHSAIKTSMNAKDSGETFVTIETVNVGGNDSINNFDSEITNQKIEE